MKEQFPILKDVIYLDSAATTQKPKVVVDSITNFYSTSNANIHRGLHRLSAKADALWKESREKVAEFLNADFEEVIFNRNTTEGLNWVVNTIGRQKLDKDSVVVITEMEHHSNIVPWQILQREIGFKIEWVPVLDGGELDYGFLEELLDNHRDRVKIVSVVHMSNVLGTVNDVRRIKNLLSDETFLVVDVAQSIAHIDIDVKDIGCDVLVFSGHKVYGPMGIGVLYCKKGLLNGLEPWMGGGGMISSVSKEGSTWNDIPYKFEAGTPNVAGGVALGVALDWFKGLEKKNLVPYAVKELENVEGINIVSNKEGLGLVTFLVDGIHAHDIASLLDEKGIAVRAGYHCAEVLHEKWDCPTVRVSFGIYNDEGDIDSLVVGLKEIIKKFNE